VSPAFQASDATALAQQAPGVQAVAPEARTGSVVVANGRNWSSSIIGSTNDWSLTNNWTIADGRAFSDDEQRAGSAVCIIVETVRR
jgi:putative ABC transport system permease protein